MTAPPAAARPPARPHQVSEGVLLEYFERVQLVEVSEPLLAQARLRLARHGARRQGRRRTDLFAWYRESDDH